MERKPNVRMRLAMGQLNAFFRRCKEMETKPWYGSKTLWINALTGIAGVLVALNTDKGLDPKIVGYAATGLGLVNMVLRLMTDKPIDGTK